MPSRRLNPNLIKLHRSYLVSELAARLDVHRNTVRQWQEDGLTPIDRSRPLLFHGATVRDFLSERNAARKRPCPPGTFYCFRCREPCAPAAGMVEYHALSPTTGNLRALCAGCEGLMHRRVRWSAIAAVMPGLAVQMREAPSRLGGSDPPSANGDFGTRGTT
jgi:hypothetical protein